MNEDIEIWNGEKLTCEGKFIGINKNGHALIQT